MEITLSGEFDSTVDTKGRFLMPALLKKQLPQNELEQLWLNRSIDNTRCLVLYPGTVWFRELKRIYSKNRYNPKVETFGRLFQAGAAPVSFDSSSRVLIPKKLLDMAGIQKDIVLKAAFDRVEIWSKEAYEDYLSNTPFSLEQLAAEVMGGDED
jgi:MraZ protein